MCVLGLINRAQLSVETENTLQNRQAQHKEAAAAVKQRLSLDVGLYMIVKLYFTF